MINDVKNDMYDISIELFCFEDGKVIKERLIKVIFRSVKWSYSRG
jgi:hypothetical protein